MQALVSNTELFEFGVQLRARKDKRFAKVELRSVERDWLLDKMKRRSAETDRLLDKIEASLASLKFAVYIGGSVVLALLIKLTFFP